MKITELRETLKDYPGDLDVCVDIDDREAVYTVLSLALIDTENDEGARERVVVLRVETED